MKVLHTSDLHLGKILNEKSFYEEQKHILDEIIDIINKYKIDVLLISGDIYDKSNPSIDAVNLFDDFLCKLSKINIEVLIISGNHDSNDRLSFGSRIFNNMNIHIETNYTGKMSVYTYNDVNFYLLPFIKPFYLKHLMDESEYQNINSSNDMIKWVLNNESIDKSKKNILLMHQYVGSNIEFSDSECLGTLDPIDVNLLDDFDYVALGHIHKPQKVKRETIRYSGTPLKYSFSEVNNKNSVVVYDTDNDNIELVELKPINKMRILKGSLEEILKLDPSDDIIKVELTDEYALSPMEEIKKIFPNAIALSFINRKTSTEVITIEKESTPLELFNDFFKLQNERDLNDEEINYLEDIIGGIK